MASGPSSAFESETFGQDASFHLDQPVGSMSISPSGRDVVLASKDGLHIIDLDSPYSPPRYLPHRTPWEVADVQWSPFAARDYWVVSTSNQKALVWNLAASSWQDTIEFVLHGHTRAITDINWSAHNPDVLATCAVDSFVHCWDLRTPLRPIDSFSDWFAGATQVKWSRQDEHVVASSHDKYLHIWDNRKGAVPLRTIEAHSTKIYGIDWNRFDRNKIVTCSLDRTIKFWNCNIQEDMPERVINTSYPVWRARHTPFGWGVLAMPQRGSSDLYLYDRRPIDDKLKNEVMSPVARFDGHRGSVKEFLWRSRGSVVDNIDHREFQLVSWGSDRELRLHRVDEESLARIGYEKGATRTQGLNFTRRGAKYRTFREGPMDLDSPLDSLPHSEALQTNSQFFHFRPRSSTNVGMSKLPVSQFRGWVQGGGNNARMGMHGRSTNKQNNDPMAWLKNVKIATWDPDTLAEEISQVGDKFKRVEFETVDIGHRKLVMSVQGPWGPDHEAIYVRVDMRFPKLYPRGANAIITLQKTNALDAQLHKSLTTEMQTITETFSTRGRGCIEAILRYLLREQSMEQVVAFILEESMLDSKTLDPNLSPEDISSDDDDDRLEGLGKPLEVTANIRVPVPKVCGALWSDNGMLVCFFPPKPTEPTSVLGGLKNVDDSQSSKLFERFGRLDTESPVRRNGEGSKSVDDESASETSHSLLGSSSSSSSASSGDALDVIGLPHYPAAALGLRQRSRSAERSNKSTTLGGTRIGESTRVNVVSIHDYSQLLPAKKSLASRYEVFGSSDEICDHNASVAVEAGLTDIASLWRLAGLILRREVPLESIRNSAMSEEEDILVISRRVSLRQTRRDGDSKPSHDRAPGASSRKESGRVRWGQSPLASGYLIWAMFSYFEQIGDIQMLAMLSCIFAEPDMIVSNQNPSASSTAVGNLALETTAFCLDYFPTAKVAESVLSSNLETNARYTSVTQSSKQSLYSLVQPVLGEKNGQRRRGISQAQDNPNAYDSRIPPRAPSVVTENSAGRRLALPSASISLSTSPEDSRLGQRTEPAAPYSGSRASLNAITQSYSNSPPSHSSVSSGVGSSVKKFSPSGSSLAPNWVPSSIFSNTRDGRGSRTSIHHSEPGNDERRFEGLRSSASFASLRAVYPDGQRMPPTGRNGVRSLEVSTALQRGRLQRGTRRHVIRTCLRNQNKFDIDGYAPVPLLDPKLEQQYKAYRSSYAHLLTVWQLHQQRAEILKFDGLPNYYDTTGAVRRANSPVKRDKLRKEDMAPPALEIRKCCPMCGEPFAPIEKNGIAVGWHCINNDCISKSIKATKRTWCSVCETAICGLSVSCLQCGHISCYACAQEWYSTYKGAHSAEAAKLKADEHNCEWNIGGSSCPAGCGCSCSMLTSIEVPHPPEQPGNSESVPTLVRQRSHASARSERFMSEHGIDTASAALYALSRSRSVSTAKTSFTRSDSIAESAINEDSASNLGDELIPWSTGKIASLGRGIGAGLSRGLTTKASDATIKEPTSK